ncbi:MAG: hypothetical protein OXG44_19360 [Gammaproteobacteria bacterium]|nr:hypothetical protein [Gammaproteobacteria bacterium]
MHTQEAATEAASTLKQMLEDSYHSIIDEHSIPVDERNAIHMAQVILENVASIRPDRRGRITYENVGRATLAAIKEFTPRVLHGSCR